MSNEFIEEFNMLLAGEISAVETCEIGLKTAERSDVREALTTCQNSHSERVDKLMDCVEHLGGTPASSSGVWGPLAVMSQERRHSELDATALLEQSGSRASRPVRSVDEERCFARVRCAQATICFQHNDETHLTMSSLLKAMTPYEVRRCLTALQFLMGETVGRCDASLLQLFGPHLEILLYVKLAHFFAQGRRCRQNAGAPRGRLCYCRRVVGGPCVITAAPLCVAQSLPRFPWAKLDFRAI